MCLVRTSKQAHMVVARVKPYLADVQHVGLHYCYPTNYPTTGTLWHVLGANIKASSYRGNLGRNRSMADIQHDDLEYTTVTPRITPTNYPAKNSTIRVKGHVKVSIPHRIDPEANVPS